MRERERERERENPKFSKIVKKLIICLEFKGRLILLHLIDIELSNCSIIYMRFRTNVLISSTKGHIAILETTPKCPFSLRLNLVIISHTVQSQMSLTNDMS